NGLFLAQAFRMRSRDVLYVSNAPFSEVQKVLSVFSTVASPVTTAASVYAVGR
ncbi:sugar transporter, partial [Methylobacterium sp. WL9]